MRIVITTFTTMAGEAGLAFRTKEEATQALRFLRNNIGEVNNGKSKNRTGKSVANNHAERIKAILQAKSKTSMV